MFTKVKNTCEVYNRHNDLYINMHDIVGVQLTYFDSVSVSVRGYDRTFLINKNDFIRYLNTHCNQGIDDNGEIVRLLNEKRHCN